MRCERCHWRMDLLSVKQHADQKGMWAFVYVCNGHASLPIFHHHKEAADFTDDEWLAVIAWIRKELKWRDAADEIVKRARVL